MEAARPRPARSRARFTTAQSRQSAGRRPVLWRIPVNCPSVRSAGFRSLPVAPHQGHRSGGGVIPPKRSAAGL